MKNPSIPLRKRARRAAPSLEEKHRSWLQLPYITSPNSTPHLYVLVETSKYAKVQKLVELLIECINTTFSMAVPAGLTWNVVFNL